MFLSEKLICCMHLKAEIACSVGTVAACYRVSWDSFSPNQSFCWFHAIFHEQEFIFQLVLNKFKKHQSQANEARAKKKKESEEADRKKKEKLAKAKAEEANIAEQSQSSKIVELTDEQAEKLQKEIDSEVRGLYF